MGISLLSLSLSDAEVLAAQQTRLLVLVEVAVVLAVAAAGQVKTLWLVVVAAMAQYLSGLGSLKH
jgi:hypothetical protein